MWWGKPVVLISFLLPLPPDTVSGPASGKFCGLWEPWAYPRNQINWTDSQLGRPHWDGNSHSYSLHQTGHWHLYFSGWDPISISKHPAKTASIFKAQPPDLKQTEIPFWSVSEEVAADFSPIWDDRGIMEKSLVPDLHLEEFLISGRQLLGPGAEWQQQEQQRAVQQEHPTAMTGSLT